MYLHFLKLFINNCLKPDNSNSPIDYGKAHSAGGGYYPPLDSIKFQGELFTSVCILVLGVW